MFKGSMVAIATPMNGDGSLDNESLERLIEFHIENKTDVIVSVGTTGESATLNFKEHSEVIKTTLSVVNKRIPVIAGSGANSTSEAIELTQRSKELGADGCLLVTPYYNKPTQNGLYEHYKMMLMRLVFHKFYIMYLAGHLSTCFQIQSISYLVIQILLP